MRRKRVANARFACCRRPHPEAVQHARISRSASHVCFNVVRVPSPSGFTPGRRGVRRCPRSLHPADSLAVRAETRRGLRAELRRSQRPRLPQPEAEPEPEPEPAQGWDRDR
eukprot:3108432-Rhodomonas_salina.1